MKIVSPPREEPRWAYNDVVFEVKKESPDEEWFQFPEKGS